MRLLLFRVNITDGCYDDDM